MVDISPPASNQNFEAVILDGSNILHDNDNPQGGKYGVHAFARISNTIREVEKLGWKTHTIMKKGTYNAALREDSHLTGNEKQTLEQLVKFGTVKITPHHNDPEIDDIIAIRFALEQNAWIISNDKFRRHLEKLKDDGKLKDINEINKRKIEVVFGPDHIPLFTPKLPVNLASKTTSKTVAETVDKELGSFAGGVNFTITSNFDDSTHKESIPLRTNIGREYLYSIGAFSNNPLIIHVSGTHFRLDWDGKSVYVTDIESTNGVTDANGSKLIPLIPEPLSVGDSFGIPGFKFKLVD
tara:strand:+ start:161 stop:1048 length:888 start_codon:yes stop_codon:yes gene_type:complete